MARSRKFTCDLFPAGCIQVPRRVIDITGKSFGKIKVIGYLGRLANATWWLCECECGDRGPRRSQSLRDLSAQSCGCERQAKIWESRGCHRKSKTKAYAAWANAIARCHNPRHKSYANYGARGITVCDEWRNNFLAFLDHIGEPGLKELELDRIDNNAGYFPGNVRWATCSQNNKNRRDSIKNKKSVLEDTFLAVWNREFPSLPAPLRQHPVRNPQTGRLWRLDFCWIFEAKKLAVEIQGGSFIRGGHNTAMGQLKDYERHNYLTSQGWEVLYFSTPMLKNAVEAVTLTAEVLCKAKEVE